MRRVVFGLALIACVAIALPLAVASEASGREFVGKVDKIGKKKLVVDNRKGDKVPFIKSDATTVSGEGKKDWKDIQKGDWVSVTWKMMDKPRVAYEIIVLPQKREAGDDL